MTCLPAGRDANGEDRERLPGLKLKDVLRAAIVIAQKAFNLGLGLRVNVPSQGRKIPRASEPLSHDGQQARFLLVKRFNVLYRLGLLRLADRPGRLTGSPRTGARAPCRAVNPRTSAVTGHKVVAAACASGH
jgi:hypothetical protein